jgi:hypothetical protein
MPLNAEDTYILAMIEAMRNRLMQPDQSCPTSAHQLPDGELIDPDILQHTFPSIQAIRTPSREALGSSRSRTRRQAVSKTPAQRQGILGAQEAINPMACLSKPAGTSSSLPSIGLPATFPLELKHAKSKYSNANRIWKSWEAHEKSYISGWTRRALVNDTAGEVEDDYYAKHKDRRRFRRKAPQYLHEMMLVFADRVATGKHALGLEDAPGEGPETKKRTRRWRVLEMAKALSRRARRGPPSLVTCERISHFVQTKKPR